MRYHQWNRAIGLSGFLLVLVIASLVAGADIAQEKTEVPDKATVRVAGILLRWNPGNCENNFKRAEGLIREATHNGAKIICTPESFLDGYSVRMPDMTREKFLSLAEEVPGGMYFSRLKEICRELKIFCIAGLTEKDSGKVYNSAVVIDPGGMLVGKYRKKYLWTTETSSYSAGTSFPSFATEYGKIGMMICSDRREPQAVKELVEGGADIIFCLAGGGYGAANDSMMQQRSIEGKVPIVFVHPLEFLVTGGTGKILTQSILDGDNPDAEPSEGRAGEIRYYDILLSGHGQVDALIRK